MCKQCKDEHLIPIDTRKVLEMIELQKQQCDILHDVMTLMYEKQRDWQQEYEKPAVRMEVKR